jgi:hypothetical protein
MGFFGEESISFPQTNSLQNGATNKDFATGLPDFPWSKHTKLGKLYQMTTDYTKRA